MLTIYEYIKYLLISRGRYSFHSPFVYDFKDKCLKISLDTDFVKIQDLHQKALSELKQIIEIEDFGAGSKHLSNFRKVSDIYKTATTKGVYLKMLSQMVEFYHVKNVLELGTSLGVGTLALSYSQNTEITTVEGCRNTQKIAIDNFPEDKISQVHFVLDQFEHFILQDDKLYDLIFIDGHHDGRALIHYLKLLEKNSHDETIFILDDIRWSNSMLNAWQEIIADENYHLSLDLFKFGLVMKRHHQNKQHFVVKINHIIRSML